MKKILCLAALFLVAVSAVAQEHVPSAEAKAAFDQAREAETKGFRGDADAFKTAVQLLQKAIALDPDYYEAHQTYTMVYAFAAAPKILSHDTAESAAAKEASEKAKKELTQQYIKLSQEHPDKAVYQWVLGWLYEYEDPDRSVSYYKEAVKLDPKCGPAWDNLGIAAEEHGDLELSREYEKKAYQAWPNDATMWRHYLGSYTSIPTPENIREAEKIVLDGADKFPDEAARMLGYTAGRTTDKSQAQAMYELLLQRFPKQAKGYTLMPLFSIYLGTDRAKAMALADQMVKNDPADKDWPQLKNYVQTLDDADSLIAAGKANAAVTALDKVKIPGYGTDRRPLDLERAKALAANGQVDKAYADLLKAYVTSPSDGMRASLNEYAQKLGKNGSQVDGDIRQQLSASAKPGMPFTLTDYATGKPVSLNDYKGRVVLVNFWYPKCGPCRGEFPYLEQSLEKYKKQGFEILAINGHPPEDNWVMPLINGWHLQFTPLKSTEDVLKDYKVRGFPSNFLYGADGKIYPMPSQVRPETLRAFELQIEALLNEAKLTSSAAPASQQ